MIVSEVAIVFERVNRLGVKLDILQLLSAWTWSEEFDLQEQFKDLSADLEPFGFGPIGDETNLLLRCCSAVIGDDASSSGLLNLNGTDVRHRFEEIRNGIHGAIDFLKNHLHIEKLGNLPYPTLLVPLTAFFGRKDGTEPSYEGTQMDELVRWFWRSCFTRRFSAGVLKKLNRDIANAKSLRDAGTKGLADIPCQITAEFFSDNIFTISTVNTSTFILLLAQQRPLSFVTGQPTTLSEALSTYNRTEFHHCFPQKYLKGQGRDQKDINRLANFAFVTRSDNNKLGGDAPSIYRSKMKASQLDQILSAAICPESLFDDDYNSFVNQRAELLQARAQELIDIQ